MEILTDRERFEERKDGWTDRRKTCSQMEGEGCSVWQSDGGEGCSVWQSDGGRVVLFGSQREGGL